MEGLGWGASQAPEARPALACIDAPSMPVTVSGIMSTIGSPVLCRERDNGAPNTSREPWSVAGTPRGTALTCTVPKCGEDIGTVRGPNRVPGVRRTRRARPKPTQTCYCVGE